MTNYRLILTLLLLHLCLFASGRKIHNDQYRFNITLPDSWLIEYGKQEHEPLLFAMGANSMLMLDVFKTEGDKVFTYRKSIKRHPIFESEYSIFIEPVAPWYNMLRHKRTMVEKTDDGVLILHLLEFRSKTLFWLQISCTEESYDTAQTILKSFNSNCTIYSYYRILRSNLRWYHGTLYLSIIPFLAVYSSLKRKKWIKSGRKDIKSRVKSIIGVILVSIIIVFMFICLKDCLALASIIGVISIAVWLVFFLGQQFLMSFIKGFFS